MIPAAPTMPTRSLVPIVQFALLMAGAGAAWKVRNLVASEHFGDVGSVFATGSTVSALLLAAAVSIRSFRADKLRRTRFSLTLPLGLILICGMFIKASIVDTSVEMAAIVRADDPASHAASVVLGPGGHDIRLTGELQEGVASRLAALLAAHPDVTRIHLTSEGGLADEGQAIGEVIEAHGLTTFIPDYCVSACTLAFVHGRERLVLREARVGFHAPYEQGLFGAMYQGDGKDQRTAYVAAGVAPDFVDAALKVDPAGIWYPTIAQLLVAHVITAPVDNFKLPDSSLDGEATLDGARALILRNFPLAKVILKRAPDEVDAIAGWYLEAYRRARPEGETSEGLKAIVQGAVVAGLARSDDETLLDLARYLDRAVAAAKSSPTCTAIGGHADLIAAAGQLEDSDSNADALADTLLSRALSGSHVLAKQLVSADPPAASIAAAKSCADWRRNYAEVLHRRPAEIAQAMRALVDAQAHASSGIVRAVWVPHG